jgi:hypothetical protein
MFKQANNEITASNLPFYIYEKKKESKQNVVPKVSQNQIPDGIFVSRIETPKSQSSFRVCSSVYNAPYTSGCKICWN